MFFVNRVYFYSKYIKKVLISSVLVFLFSYSFYSVGLPSAAQVTAKKTAIVTAHKANLAAKKTLDAAIKTLKAAHKARDAAQEAAVVAANKVVVATAVAAKEAKAAVVANKVAKTAVAAHKVALKALNVAANKAIDAAIAADAFKKVTAKNPSPVTK